MSFDNAIARAALVSADMRSFDILDDRNRSLELIDGLISRFLVTMRPGSACARRQP